MRTSVMFARSTISFEVVQMSSQQIHGIILPSMTERQNDVVPKNSSFFRRTRTK